MKPTFRFAAAACLLTLPLIACAATHAVSATNVTHHTHFSKYMKNQTWGYNIYLPDGYAGGTARYPVLYMLHGYGDTEERMIFMAETLHKAITAGEIPKIIMVFPNGGKQTFYCDYDVWKWTEGINADSYITKELIPHIDSAFRTVGTRETRLLTGFSMGGWGSLHFAFKYPELFGRVCALSPGGRDVNAANHPMALSTSNSEVIKAGTKVRLVVGGSDNLKPTSDAFDALWTKLGIAHEYEVVPGVAHSPEKIDAATGLKNLRFLTTGLPTGVQARVAPAVRLAKPSVPAYDPAGRKIKAPPQGRLPVPAFN